MNSCSCKTFFVLILLMLGVRPVFSDSIDLRGTWLFQKGDSLGWSDIGLEDSAWEYIGVPQLWETAGFRDYNGYAWYRKKVFIPESWQQDNYTQLKKLLLLELGQIDDIDQTFFNNHLIGQTGSFPPEFKSQKKAFRQYQIPLEIVNWGGENQIAIRVFDSGESGGFYAGKPRLRTPSIIDYCTIQLKLNHPNHVYEMGEAIYAWVSIQNNSTESLNARLEFTLKSVRGAMASNSEEVIEVLPGKVKKTRFRFRARIPDYYQLWMRVWHGEEEVLEINQDLGYNLERLKTKGTAEEDWAEFWTRTREQLDLIPLQSHIERIDSLQISSRHVFKVRLLSFDDVYIYGWYLVPKGRGNFPTILKIHNQPFAFDSSFEQRYPDFALFLLDVRGFGNSRAEINPGNPGYSVWHITNKEKYYCRGAIMDCIRAVDFLTLRTEVDTARLVVAGNGLGGGLALATAALDSRIKAVAVDSPLLMAFEVVTRLPVMPYHEVIQYLIEHPSEKNELFKTLSYFDLLNLAPLIKAPVLMNIMLEDQISPPISATMVYNKIKATKHQKIYPHANHGFSSNAHETMKAEWIKQQITIQ